MAMSEHLTPLGPEDARILALESGVIRGHTLKVLTFDGFPGDAILPALRAALSERVRDAPRWRQRLVPATGFPTGWGWEKVPDLDIEWHVRPACADAPVNAQELRRIIANAMRLPLDRSRPLWTVEVVPPLPDGRWALVWKVHHALADGITLIREGARLLWTDESAGERTTGRPGRAGAVTTGKSGRLPTLLGYRGLLLREFRRVWRLSPLAADVGPDRAIDFARFRLDELRAIGKAIAPEVTVNDVLLAVIAGSLRQWLAGRSWRFARMKVQVPVSMHPHRGEDDPCGNRDAFLFLQLPLAEGDPVARVRAVSRATRLRKNRHDAHAIDALRVHLAGLPAPLRHALQRVAQGPHEYSLNVSNVPGPAGPISVLGHRANGMYSFAELAPQHALRIAAVSLNGWLSVGLCADPQAVPDLDRLTAGIRGSFDELQERLSLRPGGRRGDEPAPSQSTRAEGGVYGESGFPA